MAWQPLGIVTVGEDWVSFPVLVTNSSSLRLVHVLPPNAGDRACYLSQYFAFPSPGGRSSQWRRIFSSSDPQIVSLPIPDELKGITTTYALQVKARGYYALAPWQLQAEVYYQ
jgi:hypothetical protein